MELIKDYNCTIEYHPGKANVVAAAMSRKTTVTLAHLTVAWVPLLIELRTIRVEHDIDEVGALVASIHVRPTSLDRLREAQLEEVSLNQSRELAYGRP